MKLYRFSYKTGSYGVTTVEENGDDVLVKVEQVIKYPKQGDLHNPTETESVLSHNRKALSHFEKRYTRRSWLRDSSVDVLRYEDLLQQAITNLETKLKAQRTKHAEISLASSARLKEDYSLQCKENSK